MINIYVPKSIDKNSAILKAIFSNIMKDFTLYFEDKVNNKEKNESEFIVEIDVLNLRRIVSLSKNINEILSSKEEQIEILNKTKAAFASMLGEQIEGAPNGSKIS